MSNEQYTYICPQCNNTTTRVNGFILPVFCWCEGEGGSIKMEKMKPDTTKPDIIDETLRTFSEAGLYPEFVAAVQALRRKPDVEGLSIKILNAIYDTETADGHLCSGEMKEAIQNTLKAELT